VRVLFILFLAFFLAGCFPVRHCAHCNFSNGTILDAKTKFSIKLPHWQDSILVFKNAVSNRIDTFLVVKKKLKEVDKSSFQIENSSKDYLDLSLSLLRKKDKELFRLYWGQYTCKDQELKLYLSVLDFWDWVTLINNISATDHTVNRKFESLVVNGKEYSNVWVFAPNEKGFPNAGKKDIQKIYWHSKLGLLKYVSQKTGDWERVFSKQ